MAPRRVARSTRRPGPRGDEPRHGAASDGSPEVEIEVDAERDERTGSGAFAWRRVDPGRAPRLRAEPRQHLASRVLGECRALERALAVDRTPGECRLVIRAGDPRFLHALAGWVAYPRISRPLAKIQAQLAAYASYRAERTEAPSPELARAIEGAADEALHRAAQRDAGRARAIEALIDRARTVSLRRDGEEWVANDRYRVRLDPMACECPAWSRRWAGASIAGRRAARLPCKHLVALALEEGRFDPAALAALARRAPR